MDVFAMPTYDLDGNQTTIQTSTGIWNVEYNAENRPVRWTQGNKVVTMDFDRMGRRVFYREMDGDVQLTYTKFFYNGYLCIMQLFSDDPPDIYKEFIWDPTEPVATRPLCFREYYQMATFLMHDGNKNVTDVVTVGPNNEVVGHYDYAPFGAITSQAGSRASANPFRFSSEFHDDTLGLVYYNYRHYNPQDGRWCGRDPIGENGGNNLYLQCNNMVIGHFDVLGLTNVCCTLNSCEVKLINRTEPEVSDLRLQNYGGSLSVSLNTLGLVKEHMFDTALSLVPGYNTASALERIAALISSMGKSVVLAETVSSTFYYKKRICKKKWFSSKMYWTSWREHQETIQETVLAYELNDFDKYMHINDLNAESLASSLSNQIFSLNEKVATKIKKFQNTPHSILEKKTGCKVID